MAGSVSSDIDKFISTLPKEPEPSPADNYKDKFVIPRRLAAFEKLTRHSMNRFSIDRYFDFLRTVAQELRSNSKPQDTKPGNDTSRTNQPISITSFQQIDDVMESLKTKEQTQKVTDRQAHAIKFYCTFQNDFSYLLEAKDYFYDSIYWCLLEDFYDPFTQQKPPSRKTSEKNNDSARTPNSNDKQKSERSKRPESLAENDIKRLHHVVSQLEETLTKWKGILTQGNLNMDNFDPDSYHEVVHFGNISSFELVLRTIPDIFVKYYKSIDLAREWIKLAERVYRGRLLLGRKLKRPGQNNVEKKETMQKPPPAESPRPTPTPKQSPTEIKEEPVPPPQNKSPKSAVRQYQTQITELKNKISNMDKEIDRKQKEMQVLTEDMESLNLRENRVDQLTDSFKEMDGKIETASNDLVKTKRERKNSFDNVKIIKDLEMEVDKREKKLHLLKYQKSVIQEDYLLELELRPNFIHISGDVQGRINVLKAEVDDRNTQKSQLQQELVDMVSNSDHMKDVLSDYLGREATQSDLELAKDLMDIENGTTALQTNDTGTNTTTAQYVESGQSFVSESEVDLAEYIKPASVQKPNSSRKQTTSIKTLPPPRVVGHISNNRKSNRTPAQHEHRHRHDSKGRVSSNSRVS